MWGNQTLNRIDQADDLKIAPFRPDMRTTGTPTWIWEVAVDGRLYVCAYNGMRSRWYQAAIKQQTGKIHAARQVFEVTFRPVTDEALNQKIDAAYRAKYSSSPYMAHMTGAVSRAATEEIMPK